MATPPDMRTWGLLTPADLARPLVISPHLDDAVLGCGHLLAACPGTTVATVFAGRPDAYPDPPERWDGVCGFGPGDEVHAARRAEDAAALAVLDAAPVWLDAVEHSHLERARPWGGAALVEALEAVLDAVDPTIVLAPFGLGNPDHDATHRVAMRVRARRPDPVWCCYQDLGYHLIPGLLAHRVAQLFVAGSWPTPVAPPFAPDPARKTAALACYPTQLRALEAEWGLSAKLESPEQYWRLDAPPAGWEGLATGPAIGLG